jgi:hypothetical protein
MPRTKRRLEKSPQAWQHMVFFLTKSEEFSFSEVKEAKRLCVVGRAVVNQRAPTRAKVFPAYQPSDTAWAA